MSEISFTLALPQAINPMQENIMRDFEVAKSNFDPMANLVPMVVEQTNRGERSYDIFRGFSKNVLFF